MSSVGNPRRKADRSGALRCCSLSNLRDIMAAAVAAAMATCVLSFAPAVFAQRASDSLGELLTGNAAYGDWRTDAPLVRRKITDLPPPYATRSASNPPRVIAKPVSAAPNVPPGFQVELFTSNLRDPRTVRVAPNGDIFIAESEPGRIRVLRAADGAAKPSSNDVFASGLDQPFGIAFYPSGSDPQWIYVANTGSVVRYPYRNGDLKARGDRNSFMASEMRDRFVWTTRSR
jgi:glucose/arabinose dehydrogenase